MKEVLNTMVEAIGKQTVSLGEVAEQVTALKKALAQQFPDMAETLKGQIEADQDKNRNGVFELQVALGKLREAVSQLAEAEAISEKKQRRARKTPSPQGAK